MAHSGSTVRRHLPFPTGLDAAAFRADWQASMTALDNFAVDLQGTAAARPAAGATADGGGTYYFATDTKVLTRNRGAAWDDIWISGGLLLGAAGDTNLYRLGAAQLKTDHQLRAALDVFARDGDFGQVQIGRVTVSNQAGVALGTALDTNLYRKLAGVLKTDGSLVSAVDVVANDGGAGTQIALAPDGKIKFGTALDTTLYRSSAGVLSTGAEFDAVGYIVARAGSVNQVALGATGIAVPGPGVLFGNAGDTNLYRASAQNLKTDGYMLIAQNFIARHGAASQVQAGDVGGLAGLLLGSGGDTTLYRASAGVLKTDTAFRAGGIIYANLAAATQVGMGALGTGGTAAIVWGSAEDAQLYRSAANALRTPGSLTVDGALTVGTTPFTDVTGVYRPVGGASAFGSSPAAPGAGTYLLGLAGIFAFAPQLVVSVAFYFNPADYAMAGKTTKMRVRAALVTNAVAPGTNFTVGLAPVAGGTYTGASGAGTSTAVAGAQVGNQAVFNAPAAGPGSGGTAVSADFDAAGLANGWYMLTVVNSGASAAGSVVGIRAQLQVRNV